MLLLLVLSAREGRAQSTAQIPLQFDFMNPGARSLAVGGAFIGAADDATAAFANPAGLALLTTREVSAEGRFRRMETPFLQGGRLSGTVTGRGIDTVDHAVYGTDVDREFGPTFLSLILPFNRVTIAAYRHEVVTIENAFFSEGTFERAGSSSGAEQTGRDTALGGTRTIKIRNYGGAVSYKANDRLSVGGGISVYSFNLQSDFGRFGFLTAAVSGQEIFGGIDTTKTIATATQRGDAVAVAGNAGALWSAGHGVKVGATFRRGPAFAFTQKDVNSIAGLEVNRAGQFKVPDVWGAGIEWRLSDTFRAVADYDRVMYSQLKEDFINFQAISSGRQSQLRVDDGSEVHGGVERLFLGWKVPLAIRAGTWFDPDHAVRYEPTSANDAVDVRLSATLPGGKNLMHYTFGAGAALPRGFELNGGVDLSSRTTYATVSAVIRF